MILDLRHLRFVPIVLAAVFFLLLSHFYFWQVGDDSYIYFRYIDRAVEGKWWGWTDQIAPAEGYSSPLWYFLLVFVGKMGIGAEIASRAFGIVFLLLTLCGTWTLTRLLQVPVWLAGISCLLLILNEGVHYWGTSGLETSLYAAILVWACIGIIKEKFWFLPLAAIGIARPEGPALLLALLLLILIIKRGRMRTAIVLSTLIPTIIWVVIRWRIYGEFLPNTYYAKATGEPLVQIIRGTLYCLPVLLPLSLLWTMWVKNMWVKNMWVKKQNEDMFIILGVITLLLGIILFGGGDWMLHFRLLIPLLAPLFAVLAYCYMISEKKQAGVLIFLILPLLYLSVSPTKLGQAISGQQLDVREYQEGTYTHQVKNLASQIRRRFPDKELIAVNHAGALPWALPEFSFIDMAGLNDQHIAHVKGGLHRKYDPDYVLNMKPDLIVLHSLEKPGTNGIWYQKDYWRGEAALVEHPLFIHYEPTDMVEEWHWNLPSPLSHFQPEAWKNAWMMVYKRRTEDYASR